MKKRILALLCTLGLVFTASFSSVASAGAASAGPGSYGISDYLGYYDKDRKTDSALTNAVINALAELRTEGLNANSNSIQKAKLVHDYLSKTVKYDDAAADTIIDNIKKGSNDSTAYEVEGAYGALVKHTAVCGGYTSAYTLLMNILGVPTISLDGVEEAHAWNMVNLNGKWYHVDVTLDNPETSIGKKYIGQVENYNNFLKSDSFMKSPQGGNYGSWEIWSPSLASGYNMPVANDTTYDAYDFSNVQLSDLASLMPATTAKMSLDTTSTYNGIVGHGYTFAVNSNIGEMAFATSTNPNVQISAPVYAAGRQYYTMIFKAPCTSTINVTSASGITASFPVIVKAGKENFTCDTSGTVRVKRNGKYTCLITSKQTPKVTTGNQIVEIISSWHSGNRYYYTIQADGDAGSSVGVYVNGLIIPTFVTKIV